MLAADYDPPDVTWPEPDELDGADELCNPPLDELLPELELPELEVPELEPLALELLDFEELADLLAFEPELAADVLWVAVACVEPGRLPATPPATTRLARPAATVTARILARLRFLAAICSARPVGGCWAGSGDIGCLPLGLGEPSLAGFLLKVL